MAAFSGASAALGLVRAARAAARPAAAAGSLRGGGRAGAARRRRALSTAAAPRGPVRALRGAVGAVPAAAGRAGPPRRAFSPAVCARPTCPGTRGCAEDAAALLQPVSGPRPAARWVGRRSAAREPFSAGGRGGLVQADEQQGVGRAQPGRGPACLFGPVFFSGPSKNKIPRHKPGIYFLWISTKLYQHSR